MGQGNADPDNFVDERDEEWQFGNPQTPSRHPSRPTGSAGLTPMTEGSYHMLDEDDEDENDDEDAVNGTPMTPMGATLEGASPRMTPGGAVTPAGSRWEEGDEDHDHIPPSHEPSPHRTAPAVSPQRDSNAPVRFGSLPLPSGVAPEDPHSVFATRSRLARTPVRSKRGVRVSGARPPLEDEAWMRYEEDD